MRRDDVNEIGLAILLVVTIALAIDAVWLHMKCSRQASELAALTAQVAAQTNSVAKLTTTLDQHINPPQSAEPSFSDRAKQMYEKAKSAAVKGFEAAKEEYSK